MSKNYQRSTNLIVVPLIGIGSFVEKAVLGTKYELSFSLAQMETQKDADWDLGMIMILRTLSKAREKEMCVLLLMIPMGEVDRVDC